MGIFDKNNDSCSDQCCSTSTSCSVGVGSSSPAPEPKKQTCAQPTPDSGFACTGNVSSQHPRRNRRR